MSDLGEFVIVKDGAARAFAGSSMGGMVTAVFCRGPVNTRYIATDLVPITSLTGGSAATFLDFESKVAILFDVAVRDGWLSKRVDDFRNMDLYGAELEWMKSLFQATREHFIAQLKAGPFQGMQVTDNYATWEVRLVDSIDDLRAQLAARGVVLGA